VILAVNCKSEILFIFNFTFKKCIKKILIFIHIKLFRDLFVFKLFLHIF